MPTKWPLFLRLGMYLPKKTPTEVLANLRLVSPCEPATYEGIAAIMEEERPFKTPEWIGQSEEATISCPDCSIAEVKVINKVYLELKDVLLKTNGRSKSVDERWANPPLSRTGGGRMPTERRRSSHRLGIQRRHGTQMKQFKYLSYVLCFSCLG